MTLRADMLFSLVSGKLLGYLLWKGKSRCIFMVVGCRVEYYELGCLAKLAVRGSSTGFISFNSTCSLLSRMGFIFVSS